MMMQLPIEKFWDYALMHGQDAREKFSEPFY
jgi:hypothetical protein